MTPPKPNDIQPRLPAQSPAEIQAHAPPAGNDAPPALPDYDFKLRSSWGPSEFSRLRLGLVLAGVAPFVLETFFLCLGTSLHLDQVANWGWTWGTFCMLVGITGVSILPFHPAVRFLLALLYVPVLIVGLLLWSFNYYVSVYNTGVYGVLLASSSTHH